jgi:capsular polysaccharide biosynthesis protein
VELSDYLRVLRRRWRLIVACVVIAVLAAGVFTFQATPQYASTAKLYVSATTGETSADYQGGLLAQQRVTSYVDLVTGEEVAQQVIAELGVNESASALSDRTTAALVPETSNFTVTVTDPNADRAQLLAQGMAETFAAFAAELDTPPGQRQPTVKVSVVEQAKVEASPVSPQPVRNLGLAVVLGLLLGVGLAVLRETLDTTVKSVDDVDAITETGVLGSVRFDSDAIKRPLVTDLDSHAPRVEAFRVLRTNLQYVDVDRPSKVVVITSSLPDEERRRRR